MPIDVPRLVDERVCAVADSLWADPADPRSLDAHAWAVGVSRRTLTRLFVHDTGMSFDRWRTHMRLRAALPLLAEGRSVRGSHTPWDTRHRARFSRRSAEPSAPSPRRYLNGDSVFEPSDPRARQHPQCARPAASCQACCSP
jgi:methylphosphotriester-DNA--protein-cysteine methyltransferase